VLYVKELIANLVPKSKPGVVFLELCENRKMLLNNNNNNNNNTIGEKIINKELNIMEILKSLKNGNITLFEIVYSYYLSSTASKLEVKPGAEFKMANEIGLENEAIIILGDRPVQSTIKRVWLGLDIFEKINLMFQFSSAIWMMPKKEEMLRYLSIYLSI
jgi:pheromone shutdown protein TraB